MTEQDPVLAARFAEQIAGDFPGEPIALPAGVMWTQRPKRTVGMGFRLVWRWLLQGRPRRRAVILNVGQAWQDCSGVWHLYGWHFDGRFCPHVPALDLEVVGSVTIARAMGGWPLPDLQLVAAAGRVRRRRIW